MQWRDNPYFLSLFIAGIVGLINVFFVSRRLKVTGALPLLGLGLAVSEWALAYAMELASRDLSMQLFWGKVQYFGIASVSVLFFLFAVTYAQSQKVLKSKWLWSVWLIPIVCIALVWTNESHHLIWTEVVQEQFGAFVMASFGHGPAFYLFVTYSYLLLLGGTVVLIRQSMIQPRFRGQTLLLVFGVMINWAGNIIYVSGANPIPGLDWTPIGLILSGIIYSIGLFQFRLLDLVPVAGETVLESMDDIVIVLDDMNRVVYINHAFEYYFQTDINSMVGRDAAAAFAHWPDLVRMCDQNSTIRSEVVIRLSGREPLVFDTRVTNIRWKMGTAMGRVLVMDDITEQKQAETHAALFYNLHAGPDTPNRVPLVLMYRVYDEMIIEVNRSFLLALGFERMKLLGHTMLEARLWEPYQRAEFLRALALHHCLNEFPITLKHRNGTNQSLHVLAQYLEVGGTSYVILLAENETQPDLLQSR